MTHLSTQIQAELETVRDQHGGTLSPAAVLDFAADPATALHARFTWNNDAAAHNFRLLQAAHLIRAAVTIIPAANGSVTVRAYVSTREDAGTYRAIADVLGDADLTARALASALADLQAVQAKYAAFAAIADATGSAIALLQATTIEGTDHERHQRANHDSSAGPAHAGSRDRGHGPAADRKVQRQGKGRDARKARSRQPVAQGQDEGATGLRG